MNAVLHFLSYVREGLVRSIAGDADASGIPKAATATLDITVEADGEPIVRTLGMRGPGAVIGLAAGEVLRTDPPAGAGDDHPPNTFPSVELRTPTLPWMFTPAQPNDERVIPWLVLVVVEQRAGVTLTTARSPLPVLSVDDATRELPRLEEAWAWAHVQATADPADIEALIAASPEAVTARLVCARYLDPDKNYIGCVVPSFEAGRLAGLGADYNAESVAVAWADDTGAIELPVYHSWTFRTSEFAADFEELVRRLVPMPLGPDVGVHALDISDPGSARLPSTPTVLGFEGALQSPEVVVPPWKDPGRSEFQSALEQLLEAATPGGAAPKRGAYKPPSHDPIVAPPRYGSLPSGIDDIPAPDARQSAEAPRWLSEANLDPVQRAAAGLGTEVVRRNQEALMAAAWDQAQGLARVNSLLSRTRLALEVGVRAADRLSAVEDGALVQLTANAHARLASDRAGFTMRGRVRTGSLPSGVVSAAFRRQTRAGGALAKALTESGGPDAEVTARLTKGYLEDAPAMLEHATLTVPLGTVFEPAETDDGPVFSGEVIPIDPGTWTQFGETKGTQVLDGIASTPLGKQLLDRAAPGGFTHTPAAPLPRGGGAAVRAKRATARKAPTAKKTAKRAHGTTSGTTTGESTDAVAAAQALQASLTAVQAETRPVASASGYVHHALSDLGVALVELDTLDLVTLADTINAQMDPTAVLSARLRAIISPAQALGAEPVPASIWVSPALRDPLYRMLVRIDPEYLMPGIGELPDDSVGLARINQAFVEAFMVGANNELAGEMTWREYPTLLGDTWLRTFWDTGGALTEEGTPIEDILPVADWKPPPLGTHATDEMDPSSVLVLVIKGDLPRRYPSTLITAVPARWVDGDDGKVREEDTTAAPLAPLFSGTLGGEAVFLGFQFSDVDPEGDVPGSADPDDGLPGWYFAFEQPPTEPSFGVDTLATDDDAAALEYWKDLTWGDARASEADTHVTLAALDGKTLPYDERGANQWEETWGTTAAAMARITLQRPVRMLVHADQMLEVEPDAG